MSDETPVPKPKVLEDLHLPEEMVAIKSRTDDADAKVGVVLVKSIYARWGEKEILKNVSLNAAPGKLIVVIGPVGSGKVGHETKFITEPYILKMTTIHFNGIFISGHAFECIYPKHYHRRPNLNHVSGVF